ncbi:V-type ATP synthase subunit E [Thermofilum pendens]|uniref:V-type ATP synthase subunit E n=1 Tax=Thermofilum pendens TaxID=2269 RepID=UPI001650498C|nr:V-type ATP synthase subunit E family protein [Thermofilum pendens]
MAEEKTLLEVIIQELRRAAEEESRRIVKEAEQEAQKIVEEAIQKAEAIKAEKLNQLLNEYRQKAMAELAPKRLELRHRAIREKHELIESALNRAIEEAVKTILGNDDYRRTFLEKSLEKGVVALSSTDLVVHPCRGSASIVGQVVEAVAARLSKVKPGLRLEIGDPLGCTEGVVIVSRDGREIYNATLEAKIAEVRESVKPKVLELVSRARA